MLATTTAKKLLSPIPGAITKGLFAAKAITKVPIAEAIQVARNTPFHNSDPPSEPKAVRIQCYNICHGHKRGKAGKNLGTHISTVFFKSKNLFHKSPHFILKINQQKIIILYRYSYVKYGPVKKEPSCTEKFLFRLYGDIKSTANSRSLRASTFMDLRDTCTPEISFIIAVRSSSMHI